MHRFFVKPEMVSGDIVTITGSDVNHIKNVLRMKNGDEIYVSDGEFTDVTCEITDIDSDKVIARIISEHENTELPSRIVLFQGLPKGDKMELIVQKAVELGVSEIVPVQMKRCIVKLDAKKELNKLKRYGLIAESAAKQSKRSIIPRIHGVMTYKNALTFAGGLDKVIVPYEAAQNMEETRQIISNIKKGESVGIFIGPEGGFDEDEIEQALEAGFSPISLGKRILRTETAGLATVSILMYHLED